MSTSDTYVTRLRAWLLAWVIRGTPSVARFQRACGVTAQGPTNWLLHPIFSLGAQLGNEVRSLCCRAAQRVGLPLCAHVPALLRH